MSPKPNQTELLQAITQTELAHQFAQPVSIQIELAQQKNQTIKTDYIQIIVRFMHNYTTAVLFSESILLGSYSENDQ